MVWPLVAAVALGVAGAALGGTSAKKKAKRQNANILEAAGINMQAVDQRTQQARQSFLDATEITSAQLQSSVGTARNVVGFTSGDSLTQYISSQIAAGEIDQYIRKRNLTNQIAANELEKTAIVANAKSGVVSPKEAAFEGAISGGMTGFNFGLAAGSAVESAVNSYSQSKQATEIAQKQGTLLDTQIKTAQEQLFAAKQANDFTTKQFGDAISIKQGLGYSPYQGSTRYSYDWSGFSGMNPIYPR